MIQSATTVVSVTDSTPATVQTQLKPKASLQRWAQPNANRICSVVTHSILARDPSTKRCCNLDTQDVHSTINQSFAQIDQKSLLPCWNIDSESQTAISDHSNSSPEAYLHPKGFTFTNCFGLSAEFARIQPMQAISCRY